MAGKKHNPDLDIMLELGRVTQFQDYPILVQYGIKKSSYSFAECQTWLIYWVLHDNSTMFELGLIHVC